MIEGQIFYTEASKTNDKHSPCKKCQQYGHNMDDCPNNDCCFYCGSNQPTKQCRHAAKENETPYCATCKDYGHYTGQIKCPKYPRQPPTDINHVADIALYNDDTKPPETNKLEETLAPVKLLEIPTGKTTLHAEETTTLIKELSMNTEKKITELQNKIINVKEHTVEYIDAITNHIADQIIKTKARHEATW